MKISKDPTLDVGYVKFKNGKVAETVEIRPGILLDLNKNGEVLGIELLSLKELAPALGISEDTRRRKPTHKRKLPVGDKSAMHGNFR